MTKQLIDMTEETKARLDSILFRGKTEDGKWIEGSGIAIDTRFGHVTIIHRQGNNLSQHTEVIPETVGRVTGLLDAEDKKIWEGDIVELIGGTCDFLLCGIYNYQRHEKGAKLVVQKLKSGFTLRLPVHAFKNDIPNIVGNVDNYNFWNHQRSLRVIGNIHDNPDLLK